MGKGSENSHIGETAQPKTNFIPSEPAKTLYSWSEVRKHNIKTDCWVVVNDNVYNLTNFQKIHPGGSRVINFYAGQDATEVFNAFHKEFERVGRLSKLYLIGKINPNESAEEKAMTAKKLQLESKNPKELTEEEKMLKEAEIRDDFMNIRKTAIEKGLFKPSYTFFFLHLFQIVFSQIAGYYILWNYASSGIIPVLCALFFHVIAQGQTNWSQHDYGHSSILFSPKYNTYIQMFYMGIIKGVSADWWKYMHNQHHAKPNVLNKDPDVRIDPVFILGDIQPIRRAKKDAEKKKYLYPYTIQHYLFPFAAPLLFPIFFQYTNVKYALQRKKYADLATMIPMYIIFFAISIPAFQSFFNAFAYFMLMKLIDSSWFTWVAQCNHIVMDVHDDVHYDSWLSLQLKATCNLEKSWFNDWYTGHLNFQIEHHLFPTMPRHNLYKIQPLIQSLCKKHNIRYVVKPMGQAFLDILLSLKKSGAMWREAYGELVDHD